MPQPFAYLNGRYVPAAQAQLPVSDGGFVQGTAVAEQLRTFAGRLFRLEQHIERLFHSLSIVEVEAGLTREALAEVALELVARNHPLLSTGDDLGLSMFVTPGPYAAMSAEPPAATVCLHTFPLRFAQWAAKFEQGESLVAADVAQVPAACWPPELKCRSRMHYYLADLHARRHSPGSRALMLDEGGSVLETTTANILIYRPAEGLLLPPAEKVLPGISQAVLLEIAAELDIPFAHRDLQPADVAAADEVFLTSTSPCILPVLRFNDRPIAQGHPGPVFVDCMSAWSQRVGVDVIEQAQRFAQR